jgi:hypothetical protein
MRRSVRQAPSAASTRPPRRIRRLRVCSQGYARTSADQGSAVRVACMGA